MTATVHREQHAELTVAYWGNIVVASLVAGAMMGAIMHQVMGVMQAVGALYTFETVVHGWAFHLVHSAVFALIFGGLFIWRTAAPFHDRVLASTTLGAVWGTVLWLVAAGVVMPLWLNAVGVSGPAIPSWNPWSGLSHVLWGAIVGGGSAGLHKLQRE